MHDKITRRDFMRGTATAALGLALGVPLDQGAKARVVLVRHPAAVDENSKLNGEVIAKMLDDAVMVLTGQREPLAGWGMLIKPNDVVGVKTNVWRYLPTPKELEAAVKQRLRDVGVKDEDIAFNDRGVRDDPVFQRATALINTRPLRTHYWAGIGGCIKNLITFGERWPDYHPDSCADLGLLLKLPQVRGKIRLNILCALTPQFHGRGPHHFDQRYVWRYNGLIVGTDTVAVDAVGLRLIQAKRLEHFGEEVELETTPKHIRVAGERHQVGVSDWNKIELIKLGWLQGSLI